MAEQGHTGLLRSLRELYGLIPAARRRELVPLAALIVLGGIAEVAAIAGVLPFLSLLASRQASPALDWVLNGLNSLGVRTYEQQVVATGILFMALAILAGAVRLMLTHFNQRWVFNVGHDLSVEVQRRILLQPYSFHIAHNSSEVLGAHGKVQLLAMSVLMQLIYSATSAVMAVFIIAALIRIDAFTALLSAVTFGSVYLLVSKFSARRLQQNSAVAAKTYDQRLQMIQESLGGIRDVIIDHSQAVHLDLFRPVDRRFTDAVASTQFIGLAPRYVIEAAGAVVIAALALLLWQREDGIVAALPILGAMSIGGFRLLPILHQLYFSWTSIAGHQSITAEVVEVLRLPTGAEHEGAGVPHTPMPFADSVRLEGLGFAYAGSGRPAVQDISFSIPRGGRIALLGRNGSGKSTLADLLMGLLEPTEGRITIDGTPLTAANRRAWRANIAHVPQTIFLADTSIARNIAFGVRAEELDRDRVVEAARLAMLDELIAGLPDGIDTRVGERGVRLSGGQRQRLGIARALYRKSPFLVLDEAMNALDPETERAMLRALFEADAQRTIVIISHRGSALDFCDTVVTLDRGRLVSETRPHDATGRRAKA